MKFKLMYYVIFSRDYLLFERIPSLPGILKKLKFRTTEFGESDLCSEIKRLWHTKKVALLTQEQVQEYLEELCPDYRCQTTGSLTEYGWNPAISFDSEVYTNNISENTYISPIVFQDEGDEGKEIPEGLWLGLAGKVEEAMRWLDNWIDENQLLEEERDPLPVDRFVCNQLALPFPNRLEGGEA